MLTREMVKAEMPEATEKEIEDYMRMAKEFDALSCPSFSEANAEIIFEMAKED